MQTNAQVQRWGSPRNLKSWLSRSRRRTLMTS